MKISDHFIYLSFTWWHHQQLRLCSTQWWDGQWRSRKDFEEVATAWSQVLS